jgi:cell division protein FtsW
MEYIVMDVKKNIKKFSSFLNNSVDFTLVITVLLLLVLGLVMVLSASSPTSLSESGTSYKYFSKQLIFAVLGLIAMYFISKIDYRFYQKFYIHAYILSILLLIAVLLVGKTVNNAKRWIYVTETLSFQPSELVKFCMIIFFAGILTRDREELKYFFKGWIKHLLWLAPIIVLLMLEPHMSASMVILGIVGIMMIIAGCKMWQMIVPGLVVGIPSLIGLIIIAPYRLKRVTTFLDPWSDAKDTGWQVIQSLYAIGSRRIIWSRTRAKQTKIFVFTRTTK